MGTYRTLIMGILPNYLLPVMDRIGVLGDPANLKTEQRRREKVIEAALREYFERVGAEVPEIAELLVEVRKQTMRYAKGTRGRKLANAQKIEELRMMGRRVRKDMPLPPLRYKEIINLVDQAELMEGQAREDVRAILNDDKRIPLRHRERARLEKSHPELAASVRDD